MRQGAAFGILGVCLLVALSITTGIVGWPDLWANPDQRGRLLFEWQRYEQASRVFVDPMWRGVAQMRAGNFKDAEQSFAESDSAAGAYDQGNALVMLGKYPEAVARYDRALTLRPDWPQARTNRQIAQLRAARLKAPGADAGDQREGADEIIYDKNAKQPGGQETQITGTAMNDEAVRALWLRRVQTRPADILRSLFRYQLQAQQSDKKPEASP